MEILTWKIRISVLWIFLAVGMSAAMILYLMMPGAIEEIMAGEMGGMRISDGLSIFFAIFWLIPLIMAVLSLTLKASPNRWLNFVLAILFGLFYIFDVSGHLAAGEIGGHLLMSIVGIVVAAFIAWFAWRWPKQQT
jgi:hypothetical protein